jgi:hypothetical protein
VDRNLSSRRLLKELRFKNLYPMLSSSSGKDFSKSFSETFARGSLYLVFIRKLPLPSRERGGVRGNRNEKS